jgi:hypothetical protein
VDHRLEPRRRRSEELKKIQEWPIRWSRLHRFPERPGGDERQRIVERANDGRAAARKRGVHMGRRPKLTELQRRVARERVGKGESARAIAREWGVAHTNVARVVV